MSAPVDVLADAANELEANLPDAGLGMTLAEELRGYRATVAELVDAASRYYHATTYLALDSEDHERVCRAGSRLSAALAKFGGAA